MNNPMICEWEGCTNPATHRLILSTRSAAFAPPVEVELDAVCAEHSRVQWHQVVTPEMWRRLQRIAASLNKPIPDRLYSMVKAVELSSKEKQRVES